MPVSGIHSWILAVLKTTLDHSLSESKCPPRKRVPARIVRAWLVPIPRRAFQNKTSGAHYDVPSELRERAIALGATAISRHRDRAQVRAVIARAKAQGRGEHP